MRAHATPECRRTASTWRGRAASRQTAQTSPLRRNARGWRACANANICWNEGVTTNGATTAAAPDEAQGYCGAPTAEGSLSRKTALSALFVCLASAWPQTTEAQLRSGGRNGRRGYGLRECRLARWLRAPALDAGQQRIARAVRVETDEVDP